MNHLSEDICNVNLASVIMDNTVVVRGEFHISNIDRRALLNRELGEVDVLFLEGRGNQIALRDSSIRYLFFLIGTLYFDLLYAISSGIFSKLLPFWDFDVGAEAREAGLEVENETDLEMDRIFESFNPKVINIIFVITVLALLYGLVHPLYSDYVILLSWRTPIPSWVLSMIVIAVYPMLYSGLLITIGTGGDRDEFMAKSIDIISQDNGYSKALTLVGDKHVNPVSDALEAKGWNVIRERSTHPVPRLSRVISK